MYHWSYHLVVSNFSYKVPNGIDPEFLPNAKIKTNLELDFVKQLSSARYRNRFWAAKTLRYPELMLVFTSDDFVAEYFSGDLLKSYLGTFCNLKTLVTVLFS